MRLRAKINAVRGPLTSLCVRTTSLWLVCHILESWPIVNPLVRETFLCGDERPASQHSRAYRMTGAHAPRQMGSGCKTSATELSVEKGGLVAAEIESDLSIYLSDSP